jgi:hypothetical protein
MPWIPCRMCRSSLFVDEIDEDLPGEMPTRGGGMTRESPLPYFRRPAAELQPARRERAQHNPIAIPAAERQRIVLALSDAAECADAGKPAAGYTLLVRELARAEGLLTNGEPWAGNLLARWRDAIDQYGVRLQEETDEEDAAQRGEDRTTCHY